MYCEGARDRGMQELRKDNEVILDMIIDKL